MLRIWLLVASLLALHACSEPSSPQPAGAPAFEVELEIAAEGAVRLDGTPLPGELGSAEANKALRAAALRRKGRYDEQDPLSCILPLVRVRLAVDSSAEFGRACRLLSLANGQGVHLWNLSLVRGVGSGELLPLALPACPNMHGFPQPLSDERRTVMQLAVSSQNHDRTLDPLIGWEFEMWTYDAPRELQVDLDWPQVQRLVADARAQSRTSILTRAIPSDTPWREVEVLLRQVDALGVDHYEFWPDR